MIAALYFLTKDGEVVIEKQYREQIPRVILDSFWAANVAPLPRGVTDLPTVVHHSRFAFIQIPCHDLVLMAVATTEVQPMMVIDMLSLVVRVLHPYVKDVNEENVREHFALVFQVLEEVLDNGFPLTTETAVLEELVQPPTLENRVRRLLDQPKKGKMLDNLAVPWRTPGSSYSQNELLFDVVESLDVIVDSEGSVIRSDLRGSVEVNCKLSGMPEVAARMTHADVFDDLCLHRCIRVSRYESDRTLSFVPPDGKFTLLQYRCKPTLKIMPPLYVKPQITFNRESGRINCIVGLRQGGVGLKEEERNIHKLTVTIPLPRATQTVNVHSCTTGSHFFDVATRSLVWKIGTLGSTTPSLSAEIVFRGGGALVLGSGMNIPTESAREGTGESVTVDYQVPDVSLSGLRISSVEVLNESYKLFKGVKYITRAGRFVVRTV